MTLGFTYNRNIAADYARRFGLGRSPGYLLFNHYIDRIRHFISHRVRLGNDCANFISQALAAGGIPMDEVWHYKIIKNEIYSQRFPWLPLYKTPEGKIVTRTRSLHFTDAWAGILSQYAYFKDPRNKYIDGEVLCIASDEEMNDVVNGDRLRIGDLVYFISEHKGIYHSGMITGFLSGCIRYSGHDDFRSDYPVSLSSTSKYNSIHIIRIRDSN